MDASEDFKRWLRIEYGPSGYPGDAEIATRQSLFAATITEGITPERHGRGAAIKAYGGNDRLVPLSEADTIKALLKAAAQNRSDR